jgi:hypothetical protein
MTSDRAKVNMMKWSLVYLQLIKPITAEAVSDVRKE